MEYPLDVGGEKTGAAVEVGGERASGRSYYG